MNIRPANLLNLKKSLVITQGMWVCLKLFDRKMPSMIKKMSKEKEESTMSFCLVFMAKKDVLSFCPPDT